jgi:hypothetical protein
MKRFILAFCTLISLVGCNAAPKLHSPFDGLLPDNYQVKESTITLNAAANRQMKVAIVASTNLDKEVETWVNFYEKGGNEKSKTMINAVTGALSLINPAAALGASISSRGSLDDGMDSSRKSSDPRRVLDRTFTTLKPHFKDVVVASDLASAKEMNADYIVVVDYWSTWNPMGSKYLTKTGIHVLDRSLGRVFVSEKDASVDRLEPPFLSGAQAALELLGKTVSNGMTASLLPALQSLDAMLRKP